MSLPMVIPKPPPTALKSSSPNGDLVYDHDALPNPIRWRWGADRQLKALIVYEADNTCRSGLRPARRDVAEEVVARARAELGELHWTPFGWFSPGPQLDAIERAGAQALNAAPKAVP